MHQLDGYRKQMVTFEEQHPKWEDSLQLVKGVCIKNSIVVSICSTKSPFITASTSGSQP